MGSTPVAKPIPFLSAMSCYAVHRLVTDHFPLVSVLTGQKQVTKQTGHSVVCSGFTDVKECLCSLFLDIIP